ncbi:GNAT family N-acetyltransferase [Halobellus ruber]|uniref:GNAT family N-acetyltransferase n=1 Tax=Halobellus ruber TaxID=2761102 RepID=A0A7J9SIV5_9EURY|nr:GNAT family N-acetyltransferase [Halobellus ruber]MBB6646452.1 GNAT family N-acetyltransferase [Halobellus ruber]
MVTVRPLRESDRETVAGIVAAHFAEGWSYDLPADDPASGTFVRVAERDGAVVGVMALSVSGDRAAVRDAMHLFDTVEPLPEASRYGLVHAGYVAPAHTGEGIGSRLLEALHAIGVEEGVTAFVADAWVHGGPDSPKRLLAAHGYDVVSTRSIAGHTDGPCPKCGTPCVCEAALAVRRADG